MHKETDFSIPEQTNHTTRIYHSDADFLTAEPEGSALIILKPALIMIPCHFQPPSQINSLSSILILILLSHSRYSN
jgi:hypothetical protein